MSLKEHPLYGKLKLFIIDLDGTALGGYLPYVRIPDKFSDFLDDLHRNGCEWAINTTWDPHGQWELVRQSKVKSRPLYYMGEFGRTIAVDGKKDAEPIKDYMEENNRKLDEIRKKEMDPLFRKIIAKFATEKVHHYGHLFNIMVKKESAKALTDLVTKEKENCTGLVINLKEMSVSARPEFLNKGMPVIEIMKRTGLRPEEILTAGDEKTDIAMMMPDCSKYSVCPANAPDEVKDFVLKKKGHVGTLKFSDGIIEAFNRYDI
jgi:hydroxymethylpyrimidine pyrophosphatase-like HAD family hydrolase